MFTVAGGTLVLTVRGAGFTITRRGETQTAAPVQNIGGFGSGFSAADTVTAHAGHVPAIVRQSRANVPGDANGNGRVDLGDVADFVSCMAGPDVPADTAGSGDLPCDEFFDFDGNGVIDLEDNAALQRAFDGDAS